MSRSEQIYGRHERSATSDAAADLVAKVRAACSKSAMSAARTGSGTDSAHDTRKRKGHVGS